MTSTCVELIYLGEITVASNNIPHEHMQEDHMIPCTSGLRSRKKATVDEGMKKERSEVGCTKPAPEGVQGDILYETPAEGTQLCRTTKAPHLRFPVLALRWYVFLVLMVPSQNFVSHDDGDSQCETDLSTRRRNSLGGCARPFPPNTRRLRLDVSRKT